MCILLNYPYFRNLPPKNNNGNRNTRLFLKELLIILCIKKLEQILSYNKAYLTNLRIFYCQPILASTKDALAQLVNPFYPCKLNSQEHYIKKFRSYLQMFTAKNILLQCIGLRGIFMVKVYLQMVMVEKEKSISTKCHYNMYTTMESKSCDVRTIRTSKTQLN